MEGTGSMLLFTPIFRAILITESGEYRLIRNADIQLFEFASAHFRVTISPTLSVEEFLGAQMSPVGRSTVYWMLATS